MNSDIRISVRDLSKRYVVGTKPTAAKPHMTELMRRGIERLWGRKPVAEPGLVTEHEFWALRGVNFDVREGERLGIVGRNGAGKSTLLKILARLLHPTEGEVRIRGRVTALLEVGTGFNANLTGRENVFLSASVYGLSRPEISSRLDEIVDFSGIGEFIDEPVKNYSSGMRARLGFAVAAHLDPDILILDEVLAVGDMAFANKCLNKVRGLTSGGRTVLFVSHSIGDVMRFCDQAIWLERGQIVRAGDAKTVAQEYGKSMLKLNSVVELPKVATSAASVAVLGGDLPSGKLTDGPAAQLLEFRISDAEGRNKEVFLRTEVVTLSVRFQVLREGVPLVTNIHVMREGVHVFTTHPSKPFVGVAGAVVRGEVALPADFLNTGGYSFSLRIVTPTRPITKHVVCDEALSCNIVEKLEDRAIFSSDYRGVLRPHFQWRQVSEQPATAGSQGAG